LRLGFLGHVTSGHPIDTEPGESYAHHTETHYNPAERKKSHYIIGWMDYWKWVGLKSILWTFAL